MEIKGLSQSFSVCKVADYAQVNLGAEFVFVGKTDEEVSLVCPTSEVPSGTLQRSDGWRAIRIQGELDFSLIGILAKISTILAENGIGIFVISVFDTDYILAKEENYQKALEALRQSGIAIV